MCKHNQVPLLLKLFLSKVILVCARPSAVCPCYFLQVPVTDFGLTHERNRGHMSWSQGGKPWCDQSDGWKRSSAQHWSRRDRWERQLRWESIDEEG